MTRKILMVDDQASVLTTFERTLGSSFNVDVALSAEEALARIELTPYAVVVSDLRMPGLDGLEFLAKIAKERPEIIRVMLTGGADLDAAIVAMNEGQVFQFLTKPCPVDRLKGALASAVRQHELLTAERDLLERTLGGSVALMSELLALMNPEAFRTSTRIRSCVRHMATQLQLENLWEFDLAAMLSRVGFLAVPTAILSKLHSRQALTPAEQETLLNYPSVGEGLLAKIPRFELISQIVRYQAWPALAIENGLLPRPVALGAQMIQIATYLQQALEGGQCQSAAIQFMLARPEIYNRVLVDTLFSFAEGNCMTCPRLQPC